MLQNTNLYRVRWTVFTSAFLALNTADTFAQPDVREYHLYGDRREEITDIYHCSDGTYICIGTSTPNNRIDQNRNWLFRTTEEGELIWQRAWDGLGDGSRDAAHCIIETDGGDFLIGGGADDVTPYKFVASLCSGDNGHPLWERFYSGNNQGGCRTVIETKSGEFLLGGELIRNGERHGYAILINEDGDVQREALYDPQICGRIWVAREVRGDGFYFAGYTVQNEAPLIHVNNQLEIIDAWTYPVDSAATAFTGMESYNGDFILSGNIYRREGNGYVEFPRVIRVGREGDVRWDARLLNVENWSSSFGLARMNDGTSALVGSWVGARLGVILVNREGELLWELHPFIPQAGAGEFYNAIVNRDQEFVMAGYLISQRDWIVRGVVVKLGFVSQVPEIIFITPQPPEVLMLTGEVKRFAVRAEDHQGDPITFQYKVDGEVVADSFAYITSWDDVSEHDIICTVSDDEYADSVTWHVTVTDLYISAFTPDTLDLTLRRGSSVDFSIDTVRYIEGEPPEYLWTVMNLDNPGEFENGGSETATTITFNQSGNYSVEGLAYRGESSDAVTWNVTVRGAIWAYAPEALAFEVLPDSIVTFTVEPTVPDAEGQTIRWLVDGEVVAEDTTLLQWSFGSVDNFPRYLAQVQVVVADTVESDTVSWEVTVREPDGIRDNRDAYPTRPEMLSVSPNPFNSMLTIRYDVGARHAVPLQIAIHDISGRMVAEIASPTDVFARNEETKQSVGGFAKTSSVVWDASSIPAGVYFVRLQSGHEIVTKKVVLMK